MAKDMWVGIKPTMKNIVSNGSFESGYAGTGWSSAQLNRELSTDKRKFGSKSGKYTIHTTATSNMQLSYHQFTAIPNHVYYMAGYFEVSGTTATPKVTFSDTSWAWLGTTTSGTPSKAGWQRLSAYYKNTTYTTLRARWSYLNGAVGDVMYLDGCLVVDLTETYGAGREPTQAWCDAHLDYFNGTVNPLGFEKLTNLLSGGNFANTTYWSKWNSTYTVSGNVADTVNSSSSATWGQIYKDVSITAGHIYYARVQVKYTTSTTHTGALINFKPTSNTSGDATAQGQSTKSNGTWEAISARGTLNYDSVRVAFFLPYTGSGVPISTSLHVYWRHPMLIDLTEAFGAGNEPTQDWCNKNLPYVDDVINPLTILNFEEGEERNETNFVDGYYYGTVDFSTGKFGRALSLNNKGAIQLNKSFNFGTNNFTIAGWFKRTTSTIPSWSALFSQRGYYNSSYKEPGLKVRFTSSDTIQMIIDNSYSTNKSANSTTAASTYFPVNTWVHVALVRSDSVITLYINGKSAISVNFPTTDSIYNNNFPFVIGGNAQNSENYLTAISNYWCGDIDNFFILQGGALWTGNFTVPTTAYGTYNPVPASVTRKVETPYFGVDNVVHKVKNGYIGVGGVCRQFYSSGIPASQLSVGDTLKFDDKKYTLIARDYFVDGDVILWDVDYSDTGARSVSKLFVSTTPFGVENTNQVTVSYTSEDGTSSSSSRSTATKMSKTCYGWSLPATALGDSMKYGPPKIEYFNSNARRKRGNGTGYWVPDINWNTDDYDELEGIEPYWEQQYAIVTDAGYTSCSRSPASKYRYYYYAYSVTGDFTAVPDSDGTYIITFN